MATIDDNIIDALGGTTATARKAETPLSTVHSWRKNGIPASRLAHLKLIAKTEGVDINWETGERVEHELTSTSGHSAPETGNIEKISHAGASA